MCCDSRGCKESETASDLNCFTSICHEVMGPDAMIFVFRMLSFKPAYSLPSFTFIMKLFSSSLISAIRVVSSAYLRLLIFLPATLIAAQTFEVSLVSLSQTLHRPGLCLQRLS